jgi:hypothetical protein
MCQDQEHTTCPQERFGVFAKPDEAALKHAESCEACRRALSFVQRLRNVLEEERAAAEAPQGFAEKVMLSVRDNPQRGTRHIAERVQKRTVGRSGGMLKAARRYAVPLLVSAAAAMFFLVASAFWQFRVNRMYRFVYTNAEARYEQRSDATASFVMVDGGKANVTGIIADGAVYLVGQMDDEVLGETCVFAYADDQWRTLERKVTAIGDADLAARGS